MTPAEVLNLIASDTRVLYPAEGLDADAVEELVAGGALSSCSMDGVEIVTLTPFSASVFALRIRAEIHSGELRWTPAKRSRKRRRPSKSEEQPLDLDAIADPNADEASEIAVANERIEREIEARGKRRVHRTDAELAGHLPCPQVLLTGCESWGRETSNPCPACKGLRLGPLTYCLRCDRWGLDWLLAPTRSRVVVRAKAAKFRPKVTA